jgi:transcriptional regulator with XRE-family HTH domain
MTKNVVGENIRRLRERLGLTQEELALRCDLTQGYINFLENGKRGYTQKSLTRIAEALGVTVSRLFEIKERPGKVAESTVAYRKRGRIYDEIIALLERLPDTVVEHYRMIIAAEVSVREKRK